MFPPHRSGMLHLYLHNIEQKQNKCGNFKLISALADLLQYSNPHFWIIHMNLNTCSTQGTSNGNQTSSEQEDEAQRPTGEDSTNPDAASE